MRWCTKKINSEAISKGKQCKTRYWWHQMWLWSTKVWLRSHQQYGAFVQLLSHGMRTSAHAAPNGLQYDTPYCFQLAISFLCLVTFHFISMPGSCNIITWMFPKQKHAMNSTMSWCACSATYNFLTQMNPGSKVNSVGNLKSGNVYRSCKNLMELKSYYFKKK